jgi:hypothetical protein
MDIASVLADLRNRRDNLHQAILALENISTPQPRRRGRPRTNLDAKMEPVSTTFRSKTMAAAS